MDIFCYVYEYNICEMIETFTSRHKTNSLKAADSKEGYIYIVCSLDHTICIFVIMIFVIV